MQQRRGLTCRTATRPIGAPRIPCPVWSRRRGRKIHCNQLRDGYSISRAQRNIAELAAKHENARPQARPRPDPDAGRPW